MVGNRKKCNLFVGKFDLNAHDHLGTQKRTFECLDTVFCFLEEIVALKRLKMEKEKEGFPITSLREINTLLKAQHPNIVTVRVSVQNRKSSCF